MNAKPGYPPPKPCPIEVLRYAQDTGRSGGAEEENRKGNNMYLFRVTCSDGIEEESYYTIAENEPSAKTKVMGTITQYGHKYDHGVTSVEVIAWTENYHALPMIIL